VNSQTFRKITQAYPKLRIGVLGDFCLDRYLEIDPDRVETSIETGLPVHNVINVRPQPGGAGTIVNNLSALGIGAIVPIGFAGDDGEGFELWKALEQVPGVVLKHFVRTNLRRTFTYCKPLILKPGGGPVEMSRLDSKNWTPTPGKVQDLLIGQMCEAIHSMDAVIVLDQVDQPGTGVITQGLLEKLSSLMKEKPELTILADSRRGLSGYPPVIFKMNASELSALTGTRRELSLEEVLDAARTLAQRNARAVFVSMAAKGILGANPNGEVKHIPALPVRGEIDVVGAGDAVSANLAAALAAGATLEGALEVANAAASVVIHKLGTTGTANLAELASLLGDPHDTASLK
jgi:rfaE bifunctional protein kinase chain/domain